MKGVGVLSHSSGPIIMSNVSILVIFEGLVLFGSY